jgi:hypothetical protein
MSKGVYNNRASVANSPSVYSPIFATDFGAPAPAAPSLAVAGVSGSLVTGSLFVEVTWVTAEGESLPSPQATQAVVTNDRVTVTQPTVPTGQQAVIGWRVYSAATSGSEKLNAAGTVETPASVITNQGTLSAVFPVATTAVHINVAGAGAVPPVTDNSGIQAALPLINANSGSTYYAVVPNTGSQWKVQKSVNFMCSDGIAETVGITLNHLDFIQPVYPGVNTVVAVNSYCVLNGYLFKATTGGTTATTFIGFSNFNTTKGTTTTDGSVVWTSFGKAGLVRFAFGNVTGGSLTPAAKAYELFQE